MNSQRHSIAHSNEQRTKVDKSEIDHWIMNERYQHPMEYSPRRYLMTRVWLDEWCDDDDAIIDGSVLILH
jgi:hypothetical protein